MSPIALFAVLSRPQEPSEVDRARALYQAAHRGLDGKVAPPFLDDAPPKLDLSLMGELNARVLSFPSASITVDARNGRFVGYAGYGPAGRSAPSRRVSDLQAMAQARRFYAASGQPYPMTFFGEAIDHSGTDGNGIQLDFVPAVGGVPFDRALGGTIYVDRETGQVSQFSSGDRDLPSPPPALVPRVSPEAARLAAFRTVLGLYAGSLEESEGMPMHLCVWRSSVHQDEWTRPFPTAALRADAAANRGRLAYAVGLRDLRYKSSGIKRPGVQTHVYIDALDGKVLTTRRWAGGVEAYRSPQPVVLPSGARRWRVSTGGAWSAATPSTLRPSEPGFSVGGVAVQLTDGKTAYAARFDPKLGSVSIAQADGAVSAYRPDESLAAALRRSVLRRPR